MILSQPIIITLPLATTRSSFYSVGVNWTAWTILSAGLLLAAVLVVFLTIARKGRRLRRNQRLPPPAEKAFLRWEEDGRPRDLEVFTPFYMGGDPASELVLPLSRVAHEICIFYHHSRFAFQTLPGGGPVLVNGEEKPAGYLWDGDDIQVAQRTFRFLCY